MRNAMITGAAGGIGRALVTEFVRAGYTVIATDRVPKPETLDCAQYLQVDLATAVNDRAEAGALFEHLRGLLGSHGLHALVNNAALQILGGADTLTREDWRATLDVNLLAPFFWTQALLPELEAVRGSVVNISSVHARLTKKNFVAYATSKAALSGMTRALAVDLGERVRVNAIEPAAIATDMLRAGFENRPDAFHALEGSHPQNRIGSPEEVAACALAMVRDVGRFLHGACLSLDGGIGSRLFDPD